MKWRELDESCKNISNETWLRSADQAVYWGVLWSADHSYSVECYVIKQKLTIKNKTVSLSDTNCLRLSQVLVPVLLFFLCAFLLYAVSVMMLETILDFRFHNHRLGDHSHFSVVPLLFYWQFWFTRSYSWSFMTHHHDFTGFEFMMDLSNYSSFYNPSPWICKIRVQDESFQLFLSIHFSRHHTCFHTAYDFFNLLCSIFLNKILGDCLTQLITLTNCHHSYSSWSLTMNEINFYINNCFKITTCFVGYLI